MSDEGLKLENDLCRCCQAEGRFKSLSESPRGEESFMEMLKIVLDIELKPVSDPLDRKMFAICDICIRRLEDADNFKQQVLGCERIFQQLYAGDLIKVVKEEPAKESITIKDESDSDEDYTMRDDAIKVQFKSGDDGPNDNSTRMLLLEFPPEDDNEETEIRYSKSMLQTILTEPVKKSERKIKAAPKQAAPAGKQRKPYKSKAKSKTLDEKIKQAITRQGKRKEKGKEKGKEAKVTVNADGETSQGTRNVYRLQQSDYMVIDEGIQCSYCKKILNSTNTLRFHIKTQHLKMGKYNCEICDEFFKTVARFTRHKYEKHNIDDRFQCNACNHAFNSRVQLTKHIKGFHMLGQIHKCQYCDYECFSVESMYKHNFKHKTVKDYHCKYCKKSFLRKTNLDVHERIHTGDRRKVCQECGQAFVQKASLNYHMAKYHPEVNF